MAIEKVTNVAPNGEVAELLKITQGGNGFRLTSLPFPPMGSMTFSVWFRSDAETNVLFDILGEEDTAKVTTAWSRYVHTVKAPVGQGIEITPEDNTPVYFCMAQLEQGDIASDWRVAPEDVDYSIQQSINAAYDAMDSIQKLTVGGVNLIDDSELVTIVGSDIVARSYWQPVSDLRPDTFYTISAMQTTLMAGSAAGMTCEVVQLSDPERIIYTHVLDFSGGKTQWTFTTPYENDPYAVRIYAGIKGRSNGVTVELVKVKLEEGTFATAWTESFNDTENKFKGLRTEFEVLQEGLRAVQTEYTTDETGVLHTLTGWASFWTESGIPHMGLGSSESDARLDISNNKVSFLLKNQEVAYLSDNKLFITNAEATDRIAIGTESNGYLEIVTTATGVGFVWRS